MLENFGSARSERELGTGKLKNFTGALIERYRQEDIPVDDDGRIDMEAYTSLYPDVAKDLERNRMWEEEWRKRGGLDRSESDGERLEMLAHAIFAKFLGEQFVVVRSSPHDDRINKVDTLVLDRKTGNLVCAFDEVGDTSGIRYEQKQAVVQEYNMKGGVSLKYGIGIGEENGEKVVKISSAENLPLFYLALPKDRIEKGIKEFIPELDRYSDFESKLFSYFLATLSAQTKGLELYTTKLNPDLKARLTAFKEVLGSLEKIKGSVKK